MSDTFHLISSGDEQSALCHHVLVGGTGQSCWRNRPQSSDYIKVSLSSVVVQSVNFNGIVSQHVAVLAEDSVRKFVESSV